MLSSLKLWYYQTTQFGTVPVLKPSTTTMIPVRC
jgi:hypothetical protein